jgi:DeoR/GlpR family transcriptional regulator of sugar metabolism
MAAVDEFDREQAILLELEGAGRVTVNDLAQRFGVSRVTVRKDLDGFERRGLLRRIRGGAVGIESSDEGAWSMRVRHSSEAKQAIARAVAPLIHHGDVIAMDASTTCYYLARELVDRRNLVVITNGLRTATLLMEQSTAMVVLPGGVLRRSAESMVGPIGDLLTGRGRISKGFFGLVGLSPQLGLMEVSIDEAQTKSFMAAACDEVYGLFDSSKAGRFAVHPFAPAADVHALYTDDAIPAEVAAAWAPLDVRVHAVPVPARAGSAMGATS